MIGENMVIVQGMFEVEPSERAKFLDTRLDIMREVRNEDGCLEYSLAADPISPGRVVISERWESREHLERHLDSLSAQSASHETLPRPLRAEITIYEISASQRLR